MQYDSSIANVGAAIGHPARATILSMLMDGCAHTATELAGAAGLAPSTTTTHLQMLVESNLINVEPQGRHRYYRLLSTEVAELLEQMMVLASQPLPRPKASSEPIGEARSCYDHLAGRMGVAVFDGMVDRGWIELGKTREDVDVTCKGHEALAAFDIDVSDLEKKKRRFAFCCVDWTERRHHMGGALGAALLEQFLKRNWLRRQPGSRTLMMTPSGRRLIKQKFDAELH